MNHRVPEFANVVVVVALPKAIPNPVDKGFRVCLVVLQVVGNVIHGAREVHEEQRVMHPQIEHVGTVRGCFHFLKSPISSLKIPEQSPKETKCRIVTHLNYSSRLSTAPAAFIWQAAKSSIFRRCSSSPVP